MDDFLLNYLSIRNENEEEQKYLNGLAEQFEYATMSGSFHLAIFAYHLIFMTYVYQTIFKIKIWLPDKFRLAIITFPADERREFLESKSFWVYSKIKERTVFGLLNIVNDCDELIAECKKEIVDYRNNNLGHANPVIVGEEEFNKRILVYNDLAKKIHELTNFQLAGILSEFINNLDPEYELTKDDIEVGLIIPNRLSYSDLNRLFLECQLRDEPIVEKIKKTFNEFGIGDDAEMQIVNLMREIENLQSNISNNSNSSEVEDLRNKRKVSSIMKKVQDLQDKLQVR